MIRYNDFAHTYKGIDEIVRSLLVVGNGISRKKISTGVAKLWSTTSNFDRKTVIPIGIGQPESIFWKSFGQYQLSATRIAQKYQNSIQIISLSARFLFRTAPSFKKLNCVETPCVLSADNPVKNQPRSARTFPTKYTRYFTRFTVRPICRRFYFELPRGT